MSPEDAILNVETPEITVPTVPADIPLWKDPEVRKWVHMATSYIGGLLIVVIPLLTYNLQGPSPLVPMSAGVLILVEGVLQFIYSKLNNQTVVMMDSRDFHAAQLVKRETGRLPLAHLDREE